MDVFNRLIFSSDPLLSQIKKYTKKNLNSFRLNTPLRDRKMKVHDIADNERILLRSLQTILHEHLGLSESNGYSVYLLLSKQKTHRSFKTLIETILCETKEISDVICNTGCSLDTPLVESRIKMTKHGNISWQGYGLCILE